MDKGVDKRDVVILAAIGQYLLREYKMEVQLPTDTAWKEVVIDVFNLNPGHDVKLDEEVIEILMDLAEEYVDKVFGGGTEND